MLQIATIYKKLLIIRADGTGRVVSGGRYHSLRPDEFAFRLTVTIPPAWGRTLGDIAVALPDEGATVAIEDLEEVVADQGRWGVPEEEEQ